MTSSLENFIPMQKLGEGSYSSVYKVKRINDSSYYALKKIKIESLKQKQKSNALNQIRILASISSPYIITYKEAFFDQKLNLLCIIMEWANQGDLFKQIQKRKKCRKLFSERDIWKAAYHMTSGLEILHSKNILHRDMKSANIFISNGVYKLGDLNVSKVNHEQKLAKTQTGTPYYASPQVWRDEPYDFKSDIWSLGCILYQMCCLNPPFYGKDLSQLYQNVQKGYYPKIPHQYSPELSKLIDKCLKLRAEDRPFAKQLISQQNIIFQKCQFYEISLQKLKTINKNNDLIATIKMPNDLTKLNKQLPNSKYQTHIIQPSKNSRQIIKSLQIQKNPSKSKEMPIKKQINKIQSENKKNIDPPLPQKIKNHMKSINKLANPHNRVTNRRHLPNIKQPNSNLNIELERKIEQCISASKDIINKRYRPLSCQQRRPIYNHQYQIDLRPSSGISSSNRAKASNIPKKLMPNHCKLPIYHQHYYKPPESNERIDKYNVRRIQSAHHGEINDSSYCQIKKRMQARYKNMQNNGKRIINTPYRQQIKSQNSEQLIKYKYLPSLPHSGHIEPKYKNNNSLVNNIQRNNDRNSYLLQIQNKILNSSNICDRKINKFYDDLAGRRFIKANKY